MTNSADDDVSRDEGGPPPVRTVADWILVLVALAGLGVADALVAGDRSNAVVWVAGPLVVGLASALARTGLGATRWRWICIGSTATVLAVVVGYMNLGTSREELTNEGDRIVAALESYRAAKGVYPSRLDDAGIRPTWNRFGGWDYESRDEGRRWFLSVGDYMSDGFVLHRDSARSNWSIDD
jgi:hypothetical protein